MITGSAAYLGEGEQGTCPGATYRGCEIYDIQPDHGKFVLP